MSAVPSYITRQSHLFKDKLIVVTGVSGSGKSSLVSDILFDEGRRRYLQSIGVLTSIAEEDRFESVTGIGPTVAVQQNLIRQSNPRSVVGTKTGILAYLCTLYVHAGEMACSACDKIIGREGVCLCGNVVERLTTPYFSFNSPSGMCLRCEGRGHCFELNLKKLIPDAQMTLRQVLWQAGALTSFQYLLKGRLGAYADKPFSEMPREAQEHILYGVSVRHGYQSKSLFGYLRWKLSRGRDVGDMIEMVVCSECRGYRVGEEARRVTIQG